MNARVAVVIGCNSYTFLPTLHGAEKDASNFYKTACDPALGGYDPLLSKLLLSPSLGEVRNAIDDALFGATNIAAFTFYFAGHGGSNSGSYFICLSDSNDQRMSTTALPLTYLFTVLNEAKPSQSNILIDACNAGGFAEDLATLLKPVGIGKSGSPGTSLFAAASADEYAFENADGGYATSALLAYLRGEKKFDTKRPFLDLVAIGQAASEEIGSKLNQNPVVWGLCLAGASEFSRNPHFGAASYSALDDLISISPASLTGKTIAQYADRLWEECRLTQKEPDAARLLKLIQEIILEIKDDQEALASFVLGVADSLEREAAKSEDLFGPVTIISTLVLLFLPFAAQPIAQRAAKSLLERRRNLIKELLPILIVGQDVNKCSLVNCSHLTSDLFWLPIRILKILGVLWSQILIDQIEGKVDSSYVEDLINYTNTIYKDYCGSFVAISDDQAPYLYLIGKAATAIEAQSVVGASINSIFLNLLKNRGGVARANLNDSEVVNFLISRIRHPIERCNPEELANPSGLVAVLLSIGAEYGLDESWDRGLRLADHQSLVIFIPDSHLDFGKEIIQDGVNNAFKIGHGIWSLQDFRVQFSNECAPKIREDESLSSPIVQTLCIISSTTFSDRVPWFLECKS